MTTSTNALANLSGSIVLAGAGKMGGAMLTGWLAQGVDASKLAVIDPAPSGEIATLSAKGLRINPPDLHDASVLVLAVKPQMFADAAHQLRTLVKPATLVISIMAGVPIAKLSQACGGKVVRAMPNTPAAIGRGITVAVADNGVDQQQRAIADALLRATGSVEWIADEALMDAITAVSGSGPAYVFLLAEELVPVAVQRRRLREPVGVVQGALLAFVALILAFGLTLAVGRYENRRTAVVAEANALGTTYLRAQTLLEPQRSTSLALLVPYADATIRLSHEVPETAGFRRTVAEAEALQRRLWALAGESLDRSPQASAPRLYVETLNETFDALSTRAAALDIAPVLVGTVPFGFVAGVAAVGAERQGDA